MFIRFITTGGTIDKIYFDALSQFEIGDSLVKHILTEGLAEFDYEIVPLLQKDSLDMTDEDRATLRDYIAADDADRYVVTHGTDTMPETADALASLDGKIIVLTGALSRHRGRVRGFEVFRGGGLCQRKIEMSGSLQIRNVGLTTQPWRGSGLLP